MRDGRTGGEIEGSTRGPRGPKNVSVRYVFRLIAEHIGLIRSINIDKNTGGDHPDISPASPGTFDQHLDTQDFLIS